MKLRIIKDGNDRIYVQQSTAVLGIHLWWSLVDWHVGWDLPFPTIEWAEEYIKKHMENEIKKKKVKHITVIGEFK